MKCWVVVYFSVVSLHSCTAVRVNLQGSVILGKDIFKSFSQYIHRGGALAPNRRSGSGLLFPLPDKLTEPIKWIVNSTNLGGSLKSCQGAKGDYIKDYVIALASTVEDIFTRIVASEKDENGDLQIIFIAPLKLILEEVKKILEDADSITVEDENSYHWVILVKLISDKFQVAGTKFITEKLDGDPKNIDKIKTKLIQKLIVATVAVETHFLIKLCEDLNVCDKDHQCTTTLHHLLGDLHNASNDTAKEFVRAFYEGLPSDSLVFLNSDIHHEFQVVLSELIYTANSRAKEVLTSVFQAVDARLYFIKEKKNLSKAYDQQLVNVILSDMDTVYHTDKPTYPFDNFLSQFVTWARVGGRFSGYIRAVINEIQEQLSLQPSGLIDKLKNEIKVFFDLTLQD